MRCYLASESAEGPRLLLDTPLVDSLQLVVEAADARLESLRRDMKEGWDEQSGQDEELELALTTVAEWLEQVTAQGNS